MKQPELKRAERYEWVQQARLKPEARGWAGEVRPGIRAVGSLTFAYRPPPNLFREFAGLDWNAPTLMDFVSRYGLLGLPSIAESESVEIVEPRGFDEHLGVWRVVAAMDTLRGDATPETQDAILHAVRATKHKRDWLLANIITDEISRARQRHQLIAHLTTVRRGGRLEFEDDPAPTTLIGLIWMQAALAVTGKADSFPCAAEGCKRSVKRSSDKPGPWGQFCDGNCRARQDQRRLSRARVLARERRSAKLIAADTGLSPARVRKVIETERARRKQKKRAAGSGIS